MPKTPDLNRIGKIMAGTGLAGGSGIAGYVYGGKRGLEQGRAEGFERGYEKGRQEALKKFVNPQVRPQQKTAKADEILKQAAGAQVAGQAMDGFKGLASKLFGTVPGPSASSGGTDALMKVDTNDMMGPTGIEGGSMGMGGADSSWIGDFSKDDLYTIGAGAAGIGAAGGAYSFASGDSSDDNSQKTASDKNYKVQQRKQGYVVVDKETGETVTDRPYASRENAENRKEVMEKGGRADILLRKQAAPRIDNKMESKLRNNVKKRYERERKKRREEFKDNVSGGAIAGGLTGAIGSPMMGKLVPKKFEGVARSLTPAAGALGGGSIGAGLSEPRLGPLDKEDINIESASKPKGSPQSIKSSYEASTPSGKSYTYDLVDPQKKTQVDKDKANSRTA